jgi:hypothetical protein
MKEPEFAVRASEPAPKNARRITPATSQLTAAETRSRRAQPVGAWPPGATGGVRASRVGAGSGRADPVGTGLVGTDAGGRRVPHRGQKAAPSRRGSPHDAQRSTVATPSCLVQREYRGPTARRIRRAPYSPLRSGRGVSLHGCSRRAPTTGLALARDEDDAASRSAGFSVQAPSTSQVPPANACRPSRRAAGGERSRASARVPARRAPVCPPEGAEQRQRDRDVESGRDRDALA